MHLDTTLLKEELRGGGKGEEKERDLPNQCQTASYVPGRKC